VTRAGRASLAGLLLLALVVLAGATTVLAPRTASEPGSSSNAARTLRSSPAAPAASAASAAPAHYLLVIDFLAYAAEAVASDPIPGSPDAEDLVAIVGDPTVIGTAVTDLATADVDASSRCAVIDRATVDALARALNARLPADQRIDPGSATSRSLLHWDAAEGYASLRIFVQDLAGSPSCADAGKRY
jgi:hypothetical protein